MMPVMISAARHAMGRSKPTTHRQRSLFATSCVAAALAVNIHKIPISYRESGRQRPSVLRVSQGRKRDL